MTDDALLTKLQFLLEEGAEIIKKQADEIERLRGEVLKYKALHEACKEHHGD